MSWLSGWSYRRAIVVTEATGGTLTDYQVRLALTNTSFGAIQSLGQDVRVTDSDGTTLLDYWVESFDGSANLVVWTKIPSLTASSARTLYVYYGNSGASDAQAFASVFIGGSGGATIGDLTSRVTGTGSHVTALPWRSTTDTTGDQFRALTKYSPAAITAPSPYGYCREMGIVRDMQNRAVFEGGVYVAYVSLYTADADDAPFAIGRTTSTDLITWTAPTAITITGMAAGGYQQPSALKIADGEYVMYMGGASVSTSTDNVNWTKYGNVYVNTDFNTPTPSSYCAVPWCVPLSDGSIVIVLEGYDGSAFRIYGARSTDGHGLVFTPLNGGAPLINLGTAGAWDDLMVANPKLVEPTPGNYIILYNGKKTNTTQPFDIGCATSSNLITWTKHASNPFLRGPAQVSPSYGYEMSALCLNAAGTDWLMWIQQFTGTYQTSSIWRVEPILRPALKIYAMRPHPGTFAAFVGRVMASGTFVVEWLTYLGADASLDTVQWHDGLFDSAAVPANDIEATQNPLTRLTTRRDIYDSATVPAQIGLIRRIPAGTGEYWNGAAWSGSVTKYTVSGQKGIRCKVTDDGTNYVTHMEDSAGTTILDASSVKTDIKTFTNGRVWWSGDMRSDSQSPISGIVPFMLVRKYAATEPSVSAGAQAGQAGMTAPLSRTLTRPLTQSIA